MKRGLFSLVILLFLLGLWSAPALAGQRLIVRTTNLPLLQKTCQQNSCQIVQSLGDDLNQLFLVTVPSSQSNNLIAVLQSSPNAFQFEQDMLQTTGSDLEHVTSIPSGLNTRDPVNYYGASVWSGYVNQPAVQIIRLNAARTQFMVTGAGVVADIDTGVDPNHPALASVLLTGYDFTRNAPGGSEMTDLLQPLNNSCNGCSLAIVNRFTVAALSQSTAAVLDDPYYAGFGHGTMVAGVIHLVAPTAHIMPLKVFRADGTGYVSDIIRAIYYAVQNQAGIINMSFDITDSSRELATAIRYANSHAVLCVASAGNDAMQTKVYPASLPNVVGVASTTNTNTLSSFSNYGLQVASVAAPGEGIITTYPFGTYAAGWGTSFSSPFVAGTASLILNIAPASEPEAVSEAIAEAKPMGHGMKNGLLDVFAALSYVAEAFKNGVLEVRGSYE